VTVDLILAVGDELRRRWTAGDVGLPMWDGLLTCSGQNVKDMSQCESWLC
jgi:hypothetical protein